MMKNSKRKLSNKSIIIAAVIVAVILVGIGIYFWLIPHYNLSINKATDRVTKNIDGVKQITANLNVDCNITQSGSRLNCSKQTIGGVFSSNQKVTGSINQGVDTIKIAGGKITFDPEVVSFKAVAVRSELVKSPVSKQYKITMTNADSKKVVTVYTLTVKTILTDGDLKIINKAPTAEAIKSAVEKISTVRDACITSEDNDPNGKLGKQGTYYIKVAFRDTRSTRDDTVYDEALDDSRKAKDTCEIGNDAGGSVEVFRNTKDANNRKKELDALAGGFFDSGTSKIINTTVIRTSSELKASEQQDLEQKLVDVLTK